MNAELPCCQGLPHHTYGEDCLLHREKAFDFSDPEQRRKAAEQIAKEAYEAGGFLRPGEQLIWLEPGERVLSQEDIRRLLEGEES
ncbi:hypothetical protein ACH5A3_21490 [Streptomyces echinatus]|uniref:hypothetical protein n=1 Tax=Streptomyces echinatus TaxID=67293 RepID=UPI0037882433